MVKSNFVIAASTLMLIVSCSESEEQTETINGQTVELTEEEDLSELEPVTVEDLENDGFASKMDEVEGVLIDVRTADEFNDGHIEGAMNLDYNSGAFESYLDSLDTSVPVFVYCKSGGRSGKARDILKDRGFLEIYNLKNGYGNWDK